MHYSNGRVLVELENEKDERAGGTSFSGNLFGRAAGSLLFRFSATVLCWQRVLHACVHRCITFFAISFQQIVFDGENVGSGTAFVATEEAPFAKQQRWGQ